LFPGIVDSSVYGVHLPNHDGRAGCAAIVLASSTTVELSGLAKDLRSTLPAFATPLFIRVVEDLQLTGNMKHQKNLLREEGVDPERTSGDKIFWLQDNKYVDFTPQDWNDIVCHRVTL
jgi:acyl-CoA synthetase (AMP-forming)/AMP-acid ligase II